MGIAKRKQAIPVHQYDKQGNFIKEWESKGQAAEWVKEQTGKTSNITSQIKDCILGRQKTAYGYIWKYK
jgi:predicted hydrocarbon binding protein